MLGAPLYIGVCDPANVKYILSDNFDNYEKVSLASLYVTCNAGISLLLIGI
jgi:hypothetical protein